MTHASECMHACMQASYGGQGAASGFGTGYGQGQSSKYPGGGYSQAGMGYAPQRGVRGEKHSAVHCHCTNICTLIPEAAVVDIDARDCSAVRDTVDKLAVPLTFHYCIRGVSSQWIR